MKYSKYPVVIIGSGVSGLYTALKLEQHLNTKILLVTKSTLGESNSMYAQGGIVGVLKENKKDSVSSHISDTLKAGAGLCELNTVSFISKNSDKVIKDLLNFGVKFDTDENGEITYTLEAAHSINRVLHSGGDATGRKITEALTQEVSKNKNIEIYENAFVIELLTKDKCDGIVVYHTNTNNYEAVYSSAVILATGGLGQLYKYTTNPIGATADGLALAYNAGAVMQDMEFVQFHPTALALDGKRNRFLISEAVRGEGAKLVKPDKEEFMHKYHEKQELAPRDIVTRAIYNEMNTNKLENVFLDATVINKDLLQKRFPTISKVCAKNNIDITKDLIPVAPAAHYFMGGIKTDINCQTSIKNLYAVGEVASTGLHGANRLASNSLLECVVCAYNVANTIQIEENVNSYDEVEFKTLCNKYEKSELKTNSDVKSLKNKLKDIMWNGAGIVRNEESLKNALLEISALYNEFKASTIYKSQEEYEFENMITVSNLIIKSALAREESRGAHYRTDYLNTNDASKHSIIKKEIGELSFVK